MNQQRELVRLACRLPAEDRRAALQFLRALKAKNHPVVVGLQQQQQADNAKLQKKISHHSNRSELLTKAGQASALLQFFADRLDASLMLEVQP